ncbi:MAG: flagellar hook-associated protein FlgK [Ignavibacteriales bacterium]|nr:flagellar hook-associated protein FlgK [Ignavibacteriales bacterium]MBP9119273.1 flagellar hook-associated protein FlgK [Ignavibacterium sp.]
MALTKIFDISSRSLAVYRRALEVTSHNIVNSANPNYSRQRIVFETETSNLTAGLVWGNGVKISDVMRVRDRLVDAHIIGTNQKFSDSSRQSQLVGDVEKIFSEPSDLGISNLMTTFFNSFNELAVTPNSVPLRTNVLNAANNLSAKVTSVNQSLNTLKGDIKQEFHQKVNSVNSILDQIHQINYEQFSNAYNGVPVNDLLDKRDALVDELSNLVNINVVYDNTNSAVISIGGALAVDRMHSSEFVAEEVNGKLNLKVKDGSYPIVLTGGELNALSQVYSKKIPAYQEKLDAVINNLVEAVNGEHANGFTITDPQETGLNFFEGYVNGELIINSELIDDPNKIAISLDGTEGNGEIALRIAQLTDAKLLDGNTLQESYSSMINGLGNDGMLQNNYTQANQMVLDELAQLRASQSGVSVDEEMTNVLKFQRTYEASAKLITVADEILQTILNMV